MTSNRWPCLIVSTAMTFVAASQASADSWSSLFEGIDASAIVGVETAFETNDGDVQKADIYFEPEINARLPGDLRLTAIGRLRADAEDQLEPGRPSQGERAPRSRRAIWGDHGEAELRELYLDGYWGNLSYRVGKQQTVWGQADGLRVLDLVNPLDFREFILPDFEDRRIPLWTVNMEYALGNSFLQILWIPDQTYADIPDAGATFEFTSPLVIPARPPIGVPATILPTNKPSRVVRDSDIGARLSSFINGWDLSFNYLYHYEDTPVVRRRISPTGVTVSTDYERSHLIGGSFSNTFDKITIRGELGYATGRHFITRLASDSDGVVQTDELSFVLGLDYQPTSNTLLSTQLFQGIVFDHVPGVIRDKAEGQISVLARHTFWNDRATFDLLAIQSLNDGDGLIQTGFDYELTSNLVVTIGAATFYGSDDGLFGQFNESSRISVGFEWGL